MADPKELKSETPSKLNFDPREMMEKAVEVMRESVPEYRPDGSPSPSVGAVLIRLDGSIKMAARGELREGNHAEFILLERKCWADRLDGSVLFTTLEPCLNRNHPKRGCAKHIVDARIKQVYVGIEDDNPAVAGKGIEYLRRHGVDIRMFDRDLQKKILEENRNFLEWARQQSEKPEEEPVKLSVYEDPVAAVALDDFSDKALKHYRSKALIVPEINSRRFRLLLQQQQLVTTESDPAVPTGFGLLLFGKRPRNAVQQAGLLARADLLDGKSSRKEFGDAMVLIPRQIEEWLNKVLPSTLDRSRMERREQVDLPFEIIREAVVNALVHRDYNIAGQKCQLVVNADTITILSPGGPAPPITLAQLRSFSAPMMSRNPILHYVFARMGMAEEMGYGLTSMKRHAQRLGLPLPTYTMQGEYLVLTIFRSKVAATATLGKELLEKLSKAEKAGWEWLAGRTDATQAEYSEVMAITTRTAQRHLKKFVELGLLRKSGAGSATRYELIA